MATIPELKEQNVTETPLVLFECKLPSGEIERWSTQRVEVDSQVYEARILHHNLFEIKSDSGEGIDAISKISITLSNTDSRFSQIERTQGWKGARVSALFLFFNTKQNVPASEAVVVFRGVANPPDETTEATLRITFTNRMSLQRMLLPEVRVQRRCPWKFPSTPGQRSEAVHGGGKAQYSPFFRCGYSPDVTGGTGSLDGGVPYSSCDYTKAGCQLRGMFSVDEPGQPTRRFGGIEFLPSSVSVRSYGEKGEHLSSPVENETRYNDFVPLVYGTAWYSPLTVFARNDGNLTHMEVLLGIGEIQDVLKVVVKDIEIPEGQVGKNMTGTGWYNIVSLGNRTGGFNLDFADPTGRPLGDPYGSMAVLSVVVPNAISNGSSLPRIEVLIQGLKLPTYGGDGTYISDTFTNNPAWVLLDVLRRSGWDPEDINLPSFANTAAYCDEQIQVLDQQAAAVSISRFQCNLVIKKRRSVADLVRGIRNGSRLYLTYGESGCLELHAENTLQLQQPTQAPSTNSTEVLNGGWPRYEFGDGTNGYSGVLRKQTGEPSIRVYSRSTANTANRFSLEFQDSFNEYQQDSISLVDIDDWLITGQEISSNLSALGIANFNQAGRITRFWLDKSVRGNTYVEFETSVRGIGLRPGDIITLTYLKEGFVRKPFRIRRISPGANYRTAAITAQIHDDGWYTDIYNLDGSHSGARRQSVVEFGLPRPLIGKVLGEDGEPEFEVTEKANESTDGLMSVWLRVGFVAPRRPSASGVSIPMVSFASDVTTTGGTLTGDQTLYYAISALDSDGAESPLSFLVRATIPPGTDTNKVALSSLRFSAETASFHVYRGNSPAQLLRIASSQTVSSEFEDDGLPNQLEGPPDENFDHANFYWRLELQPETEANIYTATSIGNDALQMLEDEYTGMLVRITSGKGAGQERSILSNSTDTLTLRDSWDFEPDATSSFVITESGWHLGAKGSGSPIEFEIPNRVGATIHVLGRSANSYDRECAYSLSPLTRWTIGGAAIAGFDADVPPTPVFGLAPTGQGTVEVAGIGFETLVNTSTVVAATLTLHYWDELGSPSLLTLGAAVGSSDSSISISTAFAGQPGALLQIDSEILLVEEVLEGGLQCNVLRGVHGTAASDHLAGAPVYELQKKVYILPLVKGFFGSPSSGSYTYPIFLPDARIASGEMFMTNARGNSERGRVPFTFTVDEGMRTLSGGQFSIQVEGYLAIQSEAAPPLIVEDSHSVRDVFANVREAPSGAPVELQVRQDDTPYCTLTIPAGQTVSNAVKGFGLPPLLPESKLWLDILSVGQDGNTTPGCDLTVTIRL